MQRHLPNKKGTPQAPLQHVQHLRNRGAGSAARSPQITGPPQGVYQIDEVQALFWMVAGTLSGRSMPKKSASYVVQRGVGILSTRT